uniref:Uncharacterized protein n=1 Tax=Riboviria sp. TaxID=2585031 RepID=A0A8K1WQ70_9VIRU|nr:MAG: hypothetical protein 2 [Riboviria sp.]
MAPPAPTLGGEVPPLVALRCLSLGVVRACKGIPLPAFISERTGLEKLAIAAACGWVAWKTADWDLHTKMLSAMPSVVPGWRRLRSWWTGRLETVVDPSRVYGSGVCLAESRREGSEERERTTPKWQLKVGYMRSAQLHVIGSALRFEDYLIGPDHVLGGSGEGEDEKWVAGKTGKVSMRDKELLPLATDLVAVKLPEREWSCLGAAKTGMTTLPDAGGLAQITGPEGKGTMGALTHDPVLFGCVRYAGTTLAGYSGAAYTNGATTYAMHLHGGQINGGYSMSFIACKIKELENKVLESADWLSQQARAGAPLVWNNAADPDEVIVRVKGQYHLVQRESMSRAYGEDWDTKTELFTKRTTYLMTPESGEGSAPLVANALASSSGATSAVPVVSPSPSQTPSVLLPSAPLSLSKGDMKRIKEQTAIIKELLQSLPSSPIRQPVIRALN